jgi:hypothetical protein
LDESRTGEHAAHEALALGHRAEGLEHLAIDQAKVAGIVGDVDRRQTVCRTAARSARLHARPRARCGGRRRFRPPSSRDHLLDDLGRGRQIGASRTTTVPLAVAAVPAMIAIWCPKFRASRLQLALAFNTIELRSVLPTSKVASAGRSNASRRLFDPPRRGSGSSSSVASWWTL